MSKVPKKIFSILDIIYPVRDSYSLNNWVFFDPEKNSITAASLQLSITFIFAGYSSRFMTNLGITELTYIPRSAIVGLKEIEKFVFFDDRCDIYQDQKYKDPITGEETGVDIYTSTVQHLVGQHPKRFNLEEMARKYVGKSLFDEEKVEPVRKLFVTQAKRKFDRIIDLLNDSAHYTITPDLTYARGDTEDGFHFEIAVSTPKNS